MADSLSWIKSDWFSVVQTVGIVGGLVFTGITCQQQARAQKEQAKTQEQQTKTQETQNLLAFTERHRSLWSEAYQKPELQRIFSPTVNGPTEPSIPEEEFLNVVFVHYETGWQIAESSYQRYLKPLATDIARFLSLPLPAAVWEKIKAVKDERFVRFVAEAVERN